MKRLIFILFICIFLSGCTEKALSEGKYVSSVDSQSYIILSSDHTVKYHTGGVENYKGSWTEDDSEINVYFNDHSSLIFRKLKDGMLGLKVPVENDNGGIIRYYKEK